MRRALLVGQQAPRFRSMDIFCCNAMRAEMATEDHLIFDDIKASLLTIHYTLPGPKGGTKIKLGCGE